MNNPISRKSDESGGNRGRTGRYPCLKPYAQQLSMGHPARMKAIAADKKKSDCIDARRIADLLRSDLLTSCYVLPPELRDLRRVSSAIITDEMPT